MGWHKSPHNDRCTSVCVCVCDYVSERQGEREREMEGANKQVGVYWESVGLQHTHVWSAASWLTMSTKRTDSLKLYVRRSPSSSIFCCIKPTSLFFLRKKKSYLCPLSLRTLYQSNVGNPAQAPLQSGVVWKRKYGKRGMENKLVFSFNFARGQKPERQEWNWTG